MQVLLFLILFTFATEAILGALVAAALYFRKDKP